MQEDFDEQFYEERKELSDLELSEPIDNDIVEEKKFCTCVLSDGIPCPLHKYKEDEEEYYDEED